MAQQLNVDDVGDIDDIGDIGDICDIGIEKQKEKKVVTLRHWWLKQTRFRNQIKHNHIQINKLNSKSEFQ